LLFYPYNILKEVKLQNIIIYLIKRFDHRPSSGNNKILLLETRNAWLRKFASSFHFSSISLFVWKSLYFRLYLLGHLTYNHSPLDKNWPCTDVNDHDWQLRNCPLQWSCPNLLFYLFTRKRLFNMVVEVYYDLLSQPCRAVYLFLKAAQIPFEPKVIKLLKGRWIHVWWSHAVRAWLG